MAALVRAPCEAGWNYSGGACLKHFGSPDSRRVTWQEAVASCSELGARLATVDTPAKDHLVSELIHRHGRLHAIRAWIGLQSGPGCSRDGSDWAWLEGRRPLRYSNWGDEHSLQPWDPPKCAEGGSVPQCAVVNFPTENHRWEDMPCTSRAAASWLCSKPAAFHEITSGSCKDVGLLPITDLDACEVAAAALGLDGLMAVLEDSPNRPEGCYYLPPDGFLVFSTNRQNRGNGVLKVGDFYPLVLCRPQSQRNFSGPRLQAANVSLEEQQAVEAPVSLEFILTTSFLSCLAVAAMVFVSRHEMLKLLRHMLPCARQALAGACRYGRAASGGAGNDPLSTCIVAALNRKRQQFAARVAFVFLAFECFQLAGIIFVAESICAKSEREYQNTRLQMVFLKLAGIAAASAFLAIQLRRRCRSMWLLNCMVGITLILSFVEVAVQKENDLLVRHRASQELMWRILLGVCVSPSHFFITHATYSCALILLYKQSIPEHMIAVTASGRNELFLRQGCIHLWPVESVASTLTHAKLMGTFDSAFHMEFKHVVPVLQDLLGQTTNISAFVMSELAVLVSVMVCLIVLHYCMREEIASSLRLHNSQSLLAAVSGMLTKLCDCVVHLDSHLVISRPAPQLAALLHCQASQQALVRHHLRDHLDHEDRERLKDILEDLRAEAAGPCESSGTLSLTLRDAFGVKVPCQIFHATFTSADGLPSYVLGINEIGEREALESTGLASHITQVARRQHSEESDSASSTTTMHAPSERAATDTIERQVDFILADTRVQQASIGFEHLFGVETTGRLLLDFFMDPDPFRAWLASLSARVEDGSLQLPHAAKFGPSNLQLRPHTGKGQCPRIYEVTFDVLFPERGGGRAPEEYTATAKISTMKQVRSDEARRFRRSPAGDGSPAHPAEGMPAVSL